MRMAGATWDTDAHWYRGFRYVMDGEDSGTEDLFSPGVFRFVLKPGSNVAFTAWAGAIPPSTDPMARVAGERRRIRGLGDANEGLVPDLRRAADGFVVRAPGAGRAVVSTYPSGMKSTREALIALPGLCLSTGRFEDARALLLSLTAQVEGPRVGPRPSDETSGGDALDTGLWWVVTVDRFREATGDHEFIRSKLQGPLLAILEGYRAGTRRGVGVSAEGLLGHEDGANPLGLTTNGGGEISRRGFAVEVQALWYSALIIGADLARRGGTDGTGGGVGLPRRAARESFLRAFWSDRHGYLADVVDGSGADFALRPHQLHAIGLPHALLPRDKAQRVLEVVRRTLLTPVGVGRWPPPIPRTRARRAITGLRAVALDRGAAWPCLAALYFDALIRVHGESAKAEAVAMGGRLRAPPGRGDPGHRSRRVRGRRAAPSAGRDGVRARGGGSPPPRDPPRPPPVRTLRPSRSARLIARDSLHVILRAEARQSTDGRPHAHRPSPHTAPWSQHRRRGGSAPVCQARRGRGSGRSRRPRRAAADHPAGPRRLRGRAARGRAGRALLPRGTLRGAAGPPTPAVRARYRFGGFTLSPAHRVLVRDGREVPLIPRYLDLLILLVQRRHEAVPRRDILDVVWSDVVVSDGALTQAVRSLRRALGDQSREPAFVRTVSRHGYQFVFTDVSEGPDDGPLEAPALPVPSGIAQPDPYEAALAQLLVTEPVAAGEEGEEQRREAAEALHALGTEEALRRLDQRPGHASARALLRDTRWDVRGAGLVPLLGAPAGLTAARILVHMRLRRALRLAGRRWTGASAGWRHRGAGGRRARRDRPGAGAAVRGARQRGRAPRPGRRGRGRPGRGRRRAPASRWRSRWRVRCAASPSWALGALGGAGRRASRPT
jgi:DNA-binding winged helix-turn-helix (wHTH) protein